MIIQLYRKYCNKYFICLLIVLCLCALYAPLQITTYTLRAPMPLKQPFSVALLSDLHSSRFYYEDIIKALKNMRPQVIALVGDIINDKDIQGYGLIFLNELKESFPHTPIYFVTGNHEFHGRGAEVYRQEIESLDIQVLGFEKEFEVIEIEGMKVLFAGVQDPSVTYYDLKGRRLEGVHDKGSIRWQEQYLNPLKALASYPADLKILLTHRAEFYEPYATLPFDVILSGHAHGGQVRIPFLLGDGLYAPNQGFFPKYTRGSHALNEHCVLVVSRGLNLDLYRPRIFNPPEIVKVEWVNTEG